MTSSSKLAVVVCHGCYHSTAPYMPLVDALKAEGIDAYCPQLPTSDLTKLNVGDARNPNFDLGPPAEGYPQGEQDAEVVLDLLKQLVEECDLARAFRGWLDCNSSRKERVTGKRESQARTCRWHHWCPLCRRFHHSGRRIYSQLLPAKGWHSCCTSVHEVSRKSVKTLSASLPLICHH
jgi:hypothetical protein